MMMMMLSRVMVIMKKIINIYKEIMNSNMYNMCVCVFIYKLSKTKLNSKEFFTHLPHHISI